MLVDNIVKQKSYPCSWCDAIMQLVWRGRAAGVIGMQLV